MIEALDVATLARSIAAFGLPSDDVVDPVCVGEESWSELLALVSARRITGLAVAGEEQGWLRLTPTQSRELLDRHRTAMVIVLGLERKLMVIGQALQAEGIEFIVMKGPVLAHTLYPDPWWRAFRDLDLLVSTSDWRRAGATLEGLGLGRALPEPRRGFDERFGKASVYGGNGQLEVDLHRTLVLGPFSQWVEPGALFERTVHFSLGGRQFRRLDDTMLLLHACMHASLGESPPLIVPLRDVMQIAYFGNVDWGRLTDLAVRWKLRAVFRHALQTALSSLRTPVPAQARALMEVTASRTENRALLAYTTGRQRTGWEARATLMAVDGVRAKANYLLSLIFPSRAFLAARTGDARATSYVRRFAQTLGWPATRPRRRARSL